MSRTPPMSDANTNATKPTPTDDENQSGGDLQEGGGAAAAAASGTSSIVDVEANKSKMRKRDLRRKLKDIDDQKTKRIEAKAEKLNRRNKKKDNEQKKARKTQLATLTKAAQDMDARS